jgi:hypothetical protein
VESILAITVQSEHPPRLTHSAVLGEFGRRSDEVTGRGNSDSSSVPATGQSGKSSTHGQVAGSNSIN